MFAELRRTTSRKNNAQNTGLLHAHSRDSVPVDVSADVTKRKLEHIKHLETKISEFGSLIRDKNAKLESAEKLLRETKDEHVKEVSELRKKCQQLQDKCNSASQGEKSRSARLLRQLNDTRDELDACRVAYIQLSVERDELQDLSTQELAKVKHLLLNTEYELAAYRQKLAAQTNELDRLQQNLNRLQEENRLKQVMVEELRQSKAQMQESCSGHLRELAEIRAEKEELCRQIASVTDQLSSVTQDRCQWQADLAQQTARASEANQELELLRFKWNSASSEFETREFLLTDQISFLEERLRASSTPTTDEQTLDYDTCSTSVDESLRSSEDTTDLVTSLSTPDSGTTRRQPAAGDVTSPAQLSVLLRERSLLTSRLEAMRAHLAEVKTRWNDCLMALERQVAHLNAKIVEDSEEHKLREKDYETSEIQLKQQISRLQDQLSQYTERLRVMELRSVERARDSETEIAKYQDERVSLLAENASLIQQSQQLSLARNEASQQNDKFDSQTVQSAYESATHTATEQQLTDLLKQSETSQREIEEHVNRLEQCRAELDASRTECQQTAEALQAMQNRFLVLQEESELSRTEEANQRLSLQSSLQEAEMRLRTKEDETNELKDKIAHLMLERERLSDRDLSACPSLRIEEFERKLVQRDEIIRFQRKRLKELKKTLNEHLRGGQLSSDHDSVEGLVTGLYSDSNSAHRSSSLGRLSNGSTLSLPTVSLNNALTERCLPILPSIADDHPSTASDRPCQTTTLIPNSVTHVESPVTIQLDQTHHHNSNNSAFAFNEMINLRYLRHVILKFLLSRENEALHLVRVLSTLLYLTAEEEKLIRQTLSRRRSWFKARPHLSPSKSHGQFAKIIPPLP
ncbi:hypothetical protein EG68_05201 [Paragonimus skrjabini miyazakii]|uniref:GRIP domain-containing protein n=1 Tax=Paragonimus skrjabini miyazakii TaxID=59628 RepID=A0A8S9YS66_9TREM|nr:hypothetical protein EG68_05201 [Paragonimus skrjabini miyazakii]